MELLVREPMSNPSAPFPEIPYGYEEARCSSTFEEDLLATESLVEPQPYREAYASLFHNATPEKRTWNDIKREEWNDYRSSSSATKRMRPCGQRISVNETEEALREDELETNNSKKRKQVWTKEEDALLVKAVKKYKVTNWKAIAAMVPGRTHIQCLQRWRKSLDPNVKKGRWTADEDALLVAVIEEHPHLRNWGRAAQAVPGRTAKQCRERYTNHLDPKINKGQWTEEEDKLALAGHKSLGNKWSEIASHLQGRTENSVKARIKHLKRKKIKEQREQEKLSNTARLIQENDHSFFSGM
mmetsp:Transcript_5674/g.6506  ORF Transcript_5674/g.6506 Transcript_5674/m.6506 type:complete len:299 (-) Transcript_5674:249-1145(-)|eukprot:CAMPEP_0184020764 /NCGR_PEP_ID=MMETSP0954-20121128/9536_1 /TAXON_ID=627963 /ORGANISM="Aplanochytrium sp, Strain PBS07" /LENGTH=298 /DNA_ID=CAMNT_0026302673 /DNA_START=479 /DNA_END=1375 /DNA_ORIENTATION=+